MFSHALRGFDCLIYVIGHSTRPIERFLKILKAHSVTMLIDIRTVPKSKHNPQFNSDALRDSLAGVGIDYIQTGEFEVGLDKLIRLGKSRRVAIMCAEGNPLRCHRSLVADALTIRGVGAVHISSEKPGKLHVLTSFAEVHGHRIRYI